MRIPPEPAYLRKTRGGWDAGQVGSGIAVSGSSQHQAGILGSRAIVAINKDPGANIFGIAHYGVVAKYQKMLPYFMEKCKVLLAQNASSEMH